MANKPERRARAEIDRLLAAAGGSVQSMSDASHRAACVVAIRAFRLKAGHGFADFLLAINYQGAEPRQ